MELRSGGPPSHEEERRKGEGSEPEREREPFVFRRPSLPSSLPIGLWALALVPLFIGVQKKDREAYRQRRSRRRKAVKGTASLRDQTSFRSRRGKQFRVSLNRHVGITIYEYDFVASSMM